MLDEVSVMLTSANTQLSRKHCSSHVGLGQSLDLQTDQQALLPPPLLVRLQQHLVEQQLTMMMTCTTNHMDALAAAPPNAHVGALPCLYLLCLFLLYKCWQ